MKTVMNSGRESLNSSNRTFWFNVLWMSLAISIGFLTAWFGFPTFALFALLVMPLILISPRFIVILFFFFLPLVPPEFKLDLGLSLTHDRVLLFLLIVSLILTGRKALLKIEITAVPLWVYFLLLSVINVFLLLVSENPLETFFENIYIHFFGFFMYFFFFFESANKKFQSRIEVALIMSSLVIAAIGMAETFRGSYFFAHTVEHFRGNFLRAQSTLENPIPFGVFLSISSAMVYLRLLSARTKKERLYYFFGLVVTSAGVVVSFSRQAYLSLILVFLFPLLQRTLQRQYVSQAVVSLLLIFVLVVSLFSFMLVNVDIQKLFLSGDALDNIHSRLHMSLVAFAMVLEHPLLGIGLGNFRYHAYDYQFFQLTKMPVNLWGEAPIVDNSYLTVLAETGLIGGTIFLSMLLVILIEVCATLHKNAVRQKPLQDSTSSLIILIILFNGFMVDVFEYKVFTFLFWLCTGILHGSAREKSETLMEKLTL